MCGCEPRDGLSDLLHSALIDQADRAPDAMAFRFMEDGLSTGELASRSGRLATTLVKLGVRRGDRVALYLEKSLESAIALYAAMRAGAAYVPLDPAAPPERTRALIQASGAEIVVTHKPRAKTAPAALEGSGARAAIGLDAEAAVASGLEEALGWSEALTAPEAPAMAPGASELDLAYIIFTSGSTGAPKGIMHTHRSGLAYARMAASLYDVRPDDRLSGFSPLHFDMSTFDYFSGPISGASTTIIPDAYAKLPASLSTLVEKERLTIWYSVPFALIQMLLHGALEERDLSSLRWVLYGGEPFPAKHLAALTRLWPQARFSNVYGPAEVNQCTFHHFAAPWEEADGQPPIGGPCPNVDLAVLDEEGRTLGPGGVGELIARTPTMMRGYWERPDLNALVFLDRPGAGGVADRWLRTGDLTEIRADGLLRFVGRADRQIKTRGYRVELDEVEAAITSHEAVAEAAAFPVDEGDGLTLIGAAATLKPASDAAPETLLRHIAALLPQYARPWSLSVVDAFPPHHLR